VETSYIPSAHETLATSASIFLVKRRAGGDLSLIPGECCGRRQRVENLPPYADWVVIGPVGPIKWKCRSNELLSLGVSCVLGEHFSAPRLAPVWEIDSGRDQPYKPSHGGRFCV
jgi:hypothetical protein